MKLVALLSAAATFTATYAGNDDNDNAVCTYNVKVSNARELPDEDPDILGWFGSKNYNDVYCEVIAFGKTDDKFKSVRTRTIDESETPQWDETFPFHNTDMECGGNEGGEYQKVLFKLYDDDSVGGWTAFGALDPQFLGETKYVDLSEVADCDKEYAMELTVSRSETEGGRLFVIMTKTAACCSSSGSTGGGSSGGSGGSGGSGYSASSDSKDGYSNNAVVVEGNSKTTVVAKTDDDDLKKLVEEEKKIEAEIKYVEEKEEEEKKEEAEAAVEKGKGSGGGGKSKRMIRRLMFNLQSDRM